MVRISNFVALIFCAFGLLFGVSSNAQAFDPDKPFYGFSCKPKEAKNQSVSEFEYRVFLRSSNISGVMPSKTILKLLADGRVADDEIALNEGTLTRVTIPQVPGKLMIMLVLRQSGRSSQRDYNLSMNFVVSVERNGNGPPIAKIGDSFGSLTVVGPTGERAYDSVCASIRDLAKP